VREDRPGWEATSTHTSAARRSHEEFAQALRRAGYSDEFISDVLSQLPDPIDLERDQQILARYGLSPERLMDRIGGSP
jgi:hypothetical protein